LLPASDEGYFCGCAREWQQEHARGLDARSRTKFFSEAFFGFGRVEPQPCAGKLRDGLLMVMLAQPHFENEPCDDDLPGVSDAVFMGVAGRAD